MSAWVKGSGDGLPWSWYASIVSSGGEIVAVESAEPLGPFGARGVGEITMIPVVPAITAAIYDAVGVWIDALSSTSGVVLLVGLTLAVWLIQSVAYPVVAGRDLGTYLRIGTTYKF